MRYLDISEPAMADLAAARQWLQQPGAGQRAARRLADILEALAELRMAPCRWARSEHEGARLRIVANYKIFYRVLPDTGDNETAGNVVVVRILGAGQLSDRL